MPVPLVRTTGGGDGCRWYAPFGSGSTEPYCQELRSFARLHAHQHRALAVLLRVADHRADLCSRSHLLAADLEDHVAGLEAVLGREAVGIHIGDDHAILAAAGHVARRSEREAEARNRGAGATVALVRGGASLALVRQLAEREVDGLLCALLQDGQLDRGAGRHAADLLGEIARILDRRAVDVS